LFLDTLEYNYVQKRSVVVSYWVWFAGFT